MIPAAAALMLGVTANFTILVPIQGWLARRHHAQMQARIAGLRAEMDEYR